jgi:hypothetical protein
MRNSLHSNHESSGSFDDLFNDQPKESQPASHLDDAPIGKFRRLVNEAFDAATEEHDEAERCLRYYHGHQLDAYIRAALRKRGQPPQYNNKIGPAVDSTLGLLDANQTDPEAVGRNEDDDNAALIATQILRYLVDKNDFDEIKRLVTFDAFTQGIGASKTEVDSKFGDAKVSHIPYREFFYDPASMAPDFKDATYLGQAKWVYAAQARRMYPDRTDILNNPSCGFGAGSASGPVDTPEQKAFWVQGGRILLVELYYRDDETGDWMRVHFCHAGVLDWGESDYRDDDGELTCPITAFSFKVDHEGRRYGMVKDMVLIQDAINSRASKMLHITNSAQLQITEKAIGDKLDDARKEAARPDGVIPFGIQRVNLTTDFQGNHVLLQQDIANLEALSPPPALVGRAVGANESGRSRQILQQAGLTALARVFSRYEAWELRTYRQMWFRAQQYMSDQRLIRITDNAGVRQSLQINVPIVQTVMAPVVDPSTGQPVIDPQTGRPRMMPQDQQVGTHNELAAMDMDITIKTVRQSDTLKQEALDSFLEFCAKAGVSPLSPQAEMVLEMSNITGKELLLKKMNDLQAKEAQQNAPQQAQQQQAAQHAQALAEAGTQSKIERDQAQAQRDQAMAEKHDVDAHATAYELAIKQLALKQAMDQGINPAVLLSGTHKNS